MSGLIGARKEVPLKLNKGSVEDKMESGLRLQKILQISYGSTPSTLRSPFDAQYEPNEEGGGFFGDEDIDRRC